MLQANKIKSLFIRVEPKRKLLHQRINRKLPSLHKQCQFPLEEAIIREVYLALKTSIGKEMENALPESFVMNGGDGPDSYARNSFYQRGGVIQAKDLINEAIAQKLDIHYFSSSSPFTVADFGCSTGPNTFIVVENIIEAVKLKYKQRSPEFQVYFNDHTSNDFNTLFQSLPPNRDYFATGVPGSFHGRLLPKASLHFAHTSYTLNWLSQVPNELLDRSSPAWNKGRVSYANAPKEVVGAYSAQFARDVESFLEARAQELLPGGLMAILVMCIADGIPGFVPSFLVCHDLIGSCLMDMTKMGIVSEDEVDSFNLPLYQTTDRQLKSLIEKNGCFSIEKMVPSTRPTYNPEIVTSLIRATMIGVFQKHFTSDTIDEVFRRFTKKAAQSSALFSRGDKHASELFLLLKRKL